MILIPGSAVGFAVTSAACAALGPAAVANVALALAGLCSAGTARA